MLRSFDIVMIGAMTATAVVTYGIKHTAELKLDNVRKIEQEIRLERDTIELLKADWALLTQPNRLEQLVGVYGPDLKLVPTEPTQLARPKELPMLRSQLPLPDDVASIMDAPAAKTTDKITTGSVKR
jgi:hypothetical protein